jgi:uncharacterized protein (TIGR03382 family)
MKKHIKNIALSSMVALAFATGAQAATALITLDFNETTSSGGGLITPPSAPEVTSFAGYSTVDVLPSASTTLKILTSSTPANSATITLGLSGTGLPSSVVVTISAEGSTGTNAAGTNNTGVTTGIAGGQPGLGVAGGGAEINSATEFLVFSFSQPVLVSGFSSGFWDNTGGITVNLGGAGTENFTTAAQLNNAQTFSVGTVTQDGVTGVPFAANQPIKFGRLGTTDNGVISGLSFYVPANPVPEPTTLAFGGLALLGIFRRRRA